MAEYTTSVLHEPRLVAYWRLNENVSTGVAVDSAFRYSITGSYFGAPTPGPPLIESEDGAQPTFLSEANSASADFSPGSYVQVPDVPPLRITGNLTIEAWVVPYQSNETAQIVGKQSIGGKAAPYTLGLSGGQVRFAVGNGAAETSLVGTTVPIGSPSYVAATLFRGSMILYLNGQWVAVGPLGTSSTDGGQPLYISSPIASFTGLIGEIAIYNGALSSNTVQRHFAVGRQILLDPAHYRLPDPPVYA